VQNNTRVFYLKELGSIDEYQWQVFRASNISIALDGDIENFQEFTISRQQQRKSREITRPARSFIYCNGPPLKFNNTYMHQWCKLWTNFSRCNFGVMLRIRRLLKHEVWHAFRTSRGFYQICNFH